MFYITNVMSNLSYDFDFDDYDSVQELYDDEPVFVYREDDLDALCSDDLYLL